MEPEKIEILNKSAGTGKTYELIDILIGHLKADVAPEKVLVTTFTEKAATEVRERARKALLEEGLTSEAQRIQQAWIGTVHHIGNRLSHEFAFEGGYPPEQEIIAEEEKSELFDRALEEVLNGEQLEAMEALAQRMEMEGGWSKNVEALVDKARANGMDKEALQRSRDRSLEQLNPLLPHPEEGMDDKLREALAEAIEEAERIDDTKTTRGELPKLKALLRKLETGRLLTWKEWLGLVEPGVAKKSEEAFERVTKLAGRHWAHSRFQEDLESFLRIYFDLAADVLEHYETLKMEEGVVDYTDLEVRMHELLQKEGVREELRDELELFMVDEFQDSSPLQIGIFLKLSELADHVHWVGDPKQSIYGFRDADPELMGDLIERIPDRGHGEKTDRNFRSREGLIELCNSLFEGSFSFERGGSAQVAPNRGSDPELEPPLWFWRCLGGTKKDGGYKQVKQEDKAAALAERIRDLLDDPPQVFDKEQGSDRPLRAGDIAVLCRKGGAVDKISTALEKAGLQTASQGSGLLKKAEAVLLHAALRYLVDPADKLAIMEMRLLSQKEPDPGGLIDERLEQLELLKEEDPDEWGTDDPFVRTIDAHRSSLERASVSSAVRELTHLLRLPFYATHWGSGGQRRANLEKLFSIAQEYEASCESLKKASTLSGFLLHLERIKKEGTDELASFQGKEAVNVLTYHKAKGLEWPMVLLFQLEEGPEMRPDRELFNTLDMGTVDELDIADPLRERRLRYWPWPYGGKQKLPDDLDPDLEKTELWQRREKELNGEERRLMYVGFTRARDYLIMPFFGRSWERLRSTLGVELEEGLDTREEGDFPFKLPGGNGREVPARIETLQVPEELGLPSSNPVYLPEPEGPVEHPPFHITPSGFEEEAPDPSTEVKKEAAIHERLKLHKACSDLGLGELLHAVMAAHPDYIEARDDPQGRVEGILREHGMEGVIDGAELLENVRAFEAYIQQKWEIRERKKEWPLSMMKQGQLHSGFADLILRTEEGLILIDHKSFQGGEAQALEKIKSYAKQLGLYKEMLEGASGEKVVGAYIYYPMSGLFVHVDS